MKRGMTLVEAAVFGAVASIVMVGAISMLSRSSHILEVGRRTSGAQTDMKMLLETLEEDAGELVYLEEGATSYDSQGATTGFAFYVRSSRAEKGISSADAGVPRLRRIEYKLEGSETLKDCVRTVKLVGPGAAAEATNKLVRGGISRLRFSPVVAIRQGATYQLAMANHPNAGNPGSTVLCLVVQVQAGETAGDKAIDESPLTSVVTKIWCRDRVVELSRGALQ